MGKFYGAMSYLQITASDISDQLLKDFLDMDSSEIVTMHIQSVDQNRAIKQIKHTITELDRSKIEEQKKAVRAGYDMDIIPSDLATYGNDAKSLLKELQSQNERMFLLTFLVLNTGSTKQELETNVFQANSIAQKHNCNLRRLDYQQEQGLMSSLPLAYNQIEIQRGMTTSSTAIFVPFTTQELFQDGKEALYYGQPLSIGRVMTPTLGMTVQREAAIAAFVSEPFYTVLLCVNGMEMESKRFPDRDSTASLLEACKKEEYVLIQSIEQKERTEKAPALYDLTTLQRDANRILGFTAQQTLDYTQSLYEKKLVTYPRTDSRYLTEDAAPVLEQLVPAVTALFHVSGEVVLNGEQVINSKKVSDHHALIPTKSVSSVNLEILSKGEQEILRLISIRLLAAVGEPYRFIETTVTAECAGEVFTSKGKVVVSEGWKGIVNQFFPEKTTPERTIPDTVTDAVVPVTSAQIKEGKTTPPKHFTEDLLLQAMETACADEFPEDAERKGIGTPATRAATIEKLVQKGYLERKGKGKMKHLIPTQIGQALITVAPEQIQSPSMTADWEEKLSQIEHGQYTPEQFMAEIIHMITDLVNTYEIVEGAEALMRRNQNIGICPHCGSEVVAREKGWMCRNRECRFVLWKNSAYFKKIGKPMTEHMAARLIREKRLRLKDCQSQRTGRVFTADVLMRIEEDGSPTFTMTFPNGGAKK